MTPPGRRRRRRGRLPSDPVRRLEANLRRVQVSSGRFAAAAVLVEQPEAARSPPATMPMKKASGRLPVLLQGDRADLPLRADGRGTEVNRARGRFDDRPSALAAERRGRGRPVGRGAQFGGVGLDFVRVEVDLDRAGLPGRRQVPSSSSPGVQKTLESPPNSRLPSWTSPSPSLLSWKKPTAFSRLIRCRPKSNEVGSGRSGRHPATADFEAFFRVEADEDDLQRRLLQTFGAGLQRDRGFALLPSERPPQFGAADVNSPASGPSMATFWTCTSPLPWYSKLTVCIGDWVPTVVGGRTIGDGEAQRAAAFFRRGERCRGHHQRAGEQGEGDGEDPARGDRGFWHAALSAPRAGGSLLGWELLCNSRACSRRHRRSVVLQQVALAERVEQRQRGEDDDQGDAEDDEDHVEGRVGRRRLVDPQRWSAAGRGTGRRPSPRSPRRRRRRRAGAPPRSAPGAGARAARRARRAPRGSPAAAPGRSAGRRRSGLRRAARGGRPRRRRRRRARRPARAGGSSCSMLRFAGAARVADQEDRREVGAGWRRTAADQQRQRLRSSSRRRRRCRRRGRCRRRSRRPRCP